MKRLLLYTIVSILLVLEGISTQLFIPDPINNTYWLVPHLTLIAVIMVSLYLGRKEGFWGGLIFGGLYDLVYGDVLGLFLFSFGLITYTVALITSVFHRTFFLSLVAIIGGSILLDSIHYGFFRLFQITNIDYTFALTRQMVPSSLLNLLIFIILYPLLHLLLISIEKDIEKGEGDQKWKKKSSSKNAK